MRNIRTYHARVVTLTTPSHHQVWGDLAAGEGEQGAVEDPQQLCHRSAGGCLPEEGD